MSRFQVQNYLPWLRIGLTLIISFLLLRFVLYPISQGYGFFINYTVELLHHQKSEENIRERFPASQFQRLKMAVYVLAILVVAGLALANIKGRNSDRLLKKLISYLPDVRTFFKYWKSLAAPVKFWLIVVVGLFVIQALYFAIYRPLTGDEAYTYLAFIHNGPFVSAVFYPYPNNHVLFSILAYPFSLLPVPLEVQIRLPVVLFSALSIVALYRLLSCYFDKLIAVAACGVYAFLYPVYLFGHLARGYSLYLLFGILALHYLLKLLRHSRKKYWVYFVLFSVAGLYTVPSYLYGLMGMAVPASIYLVARKNFRTLFYLTISGFCIGLFTFMLYLPIIIVAGGWNAFLQILFIDFEEKVPVTREALNFVFKNHYAFQFSGSAVIAKIFIVWSSVTAVIVCFKKIYRNKYGLLMLFAIVNIVIPLLILLLQHKLPYGRTTILISVYFAIILSISLQIFVPKTTSTFWLIIPALVMIVVNTTLGWKLQPSNEAVTLVEKSSEKMADIMMARKVQTCYNADEPSYNITLAAYYAANDQSILFDNPNAQNTYPDSSLLQIKYDCLIIPRSNERQLPAIGDRYKTAYQNDSTIMFVLDGVR